MKPQPQDFSSPFIFILSRHMQCLFHLVRQTFIFRTKVCSFALLKVRDYIIIYMYIYIYIYIYLYNNLRYARILIGSILRSIGGQTYRLRHH